MTKRQQKKIEDRVAQSFRRVGNRVQIPIMKLSDIMNAGKKAITEGRAPTEAELDEIVRAEVDKAAA